MEKPTRYYAATVKENFVAAVPFIRYALSYQPEPVVPMATEQNELTDDTQLLSIAAFISNITESSSEQDVFSKGGHVFLTAGIRDIKQIMTTLLDTHHDSDDEKILRIMSHPNTIDTIALLALRNEDALEDYMDTHLPHTGSTSTDDAYTITDPLLKIEGAGCPAAGFPTSSSQEGTVAPLRIFKEFVPWAARVVLASYDWKAERNERETPFVEH